PDNLLLKQAENEVLQEQLEAQRLSDTVSRLSQLSVIWRETKR
ncbi:MAG: hypothetical protein F6K19_33490, partial [Cyanothece sp. SIO1E1]|nr:hypothetical protein [Cyanothece sp. SIO1E1]